MSTGCAKDGSPRPDSGTATDDASTLIDRARESLAGRARDCRIGPDSRDDADLIHALRSTTKLEVVDELGRGDHKSRVVTVSIDGGMLLSLAFALDDGACRSFEIRQIVQ